MLKIKIWKCIKYEGLAVGEFVKGKNQTLLDIKKYLT